jgi:hypothetical protein
VENILAIENAVMVMIALHVINNVTKHCPAKIINAIPDVTGVHVILAH